MDSLKAPLFVVCAAAPASEKERTKKENEKETKVEQNEEKNEKEHFETGAFIRRTVNRPHYMVVITRREGNREKKKRERERERKRKYRTEYITQNRSPDFSLVNCSKNTCHHVEFARTSTACFIDR